MAVSHICLSGLLMFASMWHWVFWDLDCFRDRRTNAPAIDLPKLFGIHVILSAILFWVQGISLLLSARLLDFGCLGHYGRGENRSSRLVNKRLRPAKPSWSWLSSHRRWFGGTRGGSFPPLRATIAGHLHDITNGQH